MLSKKAFCLKLAKMVLSFKETQTDKAVLISNGELVEGVEVFIEENNEMVPAPDGEYMISENIIVVVENGVVVSVTAKDEPEPDPDPEPDKTAELIIRIEELEVELSKRDERIAELESELEEKNKLIEEQKSMLEMSHNEPIKKRLEKIEDSIKRNKALKYFV